MSSKAQAREKDYERGLRIADRRKEMGLSQDELAHRVGIGRQALSAIENGGDFKTQTLDNLAIVLGVSVDFIMYGKNEENSELLSEAMDVLSDMDELQIRQCLASRHAIFGYRTYLRAEFAAAQIAYDFDGARRDRRLLLHRPDDFDWTRHQRAE